MFILEYLHPHKSSFVYSLLYNIYTFHVCIFVATGVEVVAIEDDIKIRNSTPTKEKSYDENLLNLHKMM